MSERHIAIGQRVADFLGWQHDPCTTTCEIQSDAWIKDTLTRHAWENSTRRCLVLDVVPESKHPIWRRADRLIVGMPTVMAGMILGDARPGSKTASLLIPERTPDRFVYYPEDIRLFHAVPRWQRADADDLPPDAQRLIAALDAATDGYFSYAIRHRPWEIINEEVAA